MTRQKSRFWEAPVDCSIRSAQDLINRIEYILEAIKEESWLPAALRVLMLDGILTLRNQYLANGLTYSEACNLVGQMALGCFYYNDLTMSSKALRHVRVLDMELAGRDTLSAAG